jgi:putative tryptophan/tyrosine transport system substrate-binding protein
MGSCLRRREFIRLVGGAAAWPVAARAQQQSAMPVIGFLDSQSPGTYSDTTLHGYRRGLKELGYVEGENVIVEYRWAENQIDRLPELATALVQRQVAVIVTAAPPSALAAKSATTKIPIVFGVGGDPIELGLVASLNRPGGNLTGINFLSRELGAKRLALLREMVPSAVRVTVLVDPTFPLTEALLQDVATAAPTMGLQIQVINVSTSNDINAAFTTFARERPDALFVGTGPFLANRRVQLVHLATRHAVPAVYSGRQYSEVGGLMSYGANIVDAFRLMGVYTGRILKGMKPEDLPVVQSTTFELVINAETARLLGLTVPPALLARADEVIE